MEDQDDPLMKGEFMVMLELMQELPGAKEGKEKVKVYMTITFFITKASLPILLLVLRSVPPWFPDAICSPR